jgi:hypothetical protein
MELLDILDPAWRQEVVEAFEEARLGKAELMYVDQRLRGLRKGRG